MRNGVHHELLSDHRAGLASKIFLGVYVIVGMKKVNITTCHPQTDGLVKRVNYTLVHMLKYVRTP